MKIRFSLIIAGAVIGFSQLTHAQCPEICDGNENTALGQSALVNNTTGVRNTGLGFQALRNNNGESNTATGYQALFSNSSGDFNTAYGVQALLSNTVASFNTATGAFALAINTNGSQNTAVGYQALSRSTTASSNTAMGWNALGTDTTGFRNTAVGNDALSRNTTGFINIAVGDSAGSNLTTGRNNIDVGNPGVAAESNTIRIGIRGTQTDTYIAGISGRAVAGGVGVLIDSNGHLGTNTSSARFKENIQPMDKASEAILFLQPVTFHYKKALDPAGISQFGLVAEQVEKVDPDLVARDDEGKPYTVRYEAVNAMLLNEFLKEHRKVETQEATITQLKSAVAQQQSANAEQQKAIEALTTALKGQEAQIQKVSDQLRTQAATPRVVANNQ